MLLIRLKCSVRVDEAGGIKVHLSLSVILTAAQIVFHTLAPSPLSLKS